MKEVYDELTDNGANYIPEVPKKEVVQLDNL